MSQDAQKLITCWDCNGSGTILFAFPQKGGRTGITCDRCKGTGECPSIMREWVQVGKRHAVHRISVLKQTLRKFSEETGIDVVAISKAERGVTDIRSLIPSSALL